MVGIPYNTIYFINYDISSYPVKIKEFSYKIFYLSLFYYLSYNTS